MEIYKYVETYKYIELTWISLVINFFLLGYWLFKKILHKHYPKHMRAWCIIGMVVLFIVSFTLSNIRAMAAPENRELARIATSPWTGFSGGAMIAMAIAYNDKLKKQKEKEDKKEKKE